MHYPIQPRESVAVCRESVPLVGAQVRQEIQNFFRALDSYPARVAKEPRLSFHQHLCSLFAASPGRGSDDRRETRPRRQ
jgi:hypothetical protein